MNRSDASQLKEVYILYEYMVRVGGLPESNDKTMLLSWDAAWQRPEHELYMKVLQSNFRGEAEEVITALGGHSHQLPDLIRLELAFAYFATGDYRNAAREIEAVNIPSWQAHRLIYLKSITYFELGLYERALENTLQYLNQFGLRDEVLRIACVSLSQLNRLPDAKRLTNIGLEKFGLTVEWLVTDANIARRLGDLRGAKHSLELALQRSPDHPIANFNYAFLLLKTGRYREGWFHYHRRWELGYPSHPPPKGRTVGKPLRCDHLLGDLTQSRLLLWCEQGLGDVIHFIRYVPKLVCKFMSCTVMVPETLQPLLQRSFPSPKMRWIRTTMEISGNDYDFNASVIDIPMIMGLDTEEKLRTDNPYLCVRTEQSGGSDAIALIQPNGSNNKREPARKVGIVWRGGLGSRYQPDRSTTMHFLVELLHGISDIYIIQKELNDQEKQEVVALGLKVCLTEQSNFEDTAAIMMSLDAVISIDTAVAHLSGALGIPTCILLIEDSDFRWGSGASTYLYPTATLVRRRSNNWGTCSEAILKFIAGLKAPED